MLWLKKIPDIVDKSSISKICVDDFAIRKRYTYGTVMVDLEAHRIVDIINSRETEKAAEWLKTYPNIQVISRDGASTYANASSLSHPEACQISDRFHLFKNLSEVFSRFLMRQFPSRIEIPADKESAQIVPEWFFYSGNQPYDRTYFGNRKKVSEPCMYR